MNESSADDTASQRVLLEPGSVVLMDRDLSSVKKRSMCTSRTGRVPAMQPSGVVASWRVIGVNTAASTSTIVSSPGSNRSGVRLPQAASSHGAAASHGERPGARFDIEIRLTLAGAKVNRYQGVARAQRPYAAPV